MLNNRVTASLFWLGLVFVLAMLKPAVRSGFRGVVQQDNEEQRETARHALRGFIDQIVIPPGEGLLQVIGHFGEMLSAAGGRQAVAYVGCGGLQPSIPTAIYHVAA